MFHQGYILSVYLVLLAKSCHGLEPDDFRIQSIPAKKVGESLYLTCIYPSPFSDMEWMDPNGVVYSAGMSNVFEGSGTLSLSISTVKSDSGGRYTCRGQNTTFENNTVQMTTSINVTIYEPLMFVDTPKVQPFRLGDDAEVKCRVEGNPPGRIQWDQGKRDFSKNKSSSEGIYEDDVTSNLIIKNIMKDDEGEYQCTATEQRYGQFQQQTIYVDVQFAPSQVEVQPMASVVQGKNITLQCNSTAEPEPSYKWYRVGATENNLEPIESVNTNGKELIFENVQLSQAGKYACVVSNIMGKRTNTTELSVLVPPSIITATNTSVKIGSPATLQCSANGLPMPVIDIYLGGKKVDDISFDESNVTVSRDVGVTTIVFDSATPENAGSYYCVATSDAGLDGAAMALQVLYPPLDRMLPPVQGCLHGEAVLSCRFDAYPKPTLEWGKFIDVVADTNDLSMELNDSASNTSAEASVSKKFIPISPESNYVVVKGSDDSLQLRIEKISEASFGEYICKAKNSQGENIATATLAEADLPGRPYSVQATDVSTKSVTISFMTPMEMFVPVIAYNITLINLRNYETEFIIRTNKFPDQATAFEQFMRIKRLQHNTEYLLTLAGLNCRGQSEESENVVFKTKTIAKPESLQVTSSSLSQSSVNYTLKWEISGNGGGSLKKIIISVYEQNADTDVNATASNSITIKKNSVHFSSQFYTISDLSPSTTYLVNLVVYNEVESASTLFNFTTSAAPIDGTTSSPDTGKGGFIFNRAMVIMVIVLVAIFFIVFDVSCCVSRHCGFLYCVQSLCCPKSGPSKDGKKDAESSVEYKKEAEADEEALLNQTNDQTNTTTGDANTTSKNAK